MAKNNDAGSGGIGESQDPLLNQEGQGGSPQNEAGEGTPPANGDQDLDDDQGGEGDQGDTAGAAGASEKGKPGRKKKYTGKISNPDMAGKTTYGVTGKPIVFDEDGIAEVDEVEGLHLAQVPGYKVV